MDSLLQPTLQASGSGPVDRRGLSRPGRVRSAGREVRRRRRWRL